MSTENYLDNLHRDLTKVQENVVQLKIKLQARILARWWMIGCDYEAQDFWMAVATVLAGPHSIDVDPALSAGQVVAIRRLSAYDQGRIVCGSEAAREKFIRNMTASAR